MHECFPQISLVLCVVHDHNTSDREKLAVDSRRQRYLRFHSTGHYTPTDACNSALMIPRPASLGVFKVSTAAMSSADGGSFGVCSQDSSRRRIPHESQSTLRHGSFSPKWQILFCVCVFLVLFLPIPASSDVTCAHANSTCSDCASLCGVAQFFPLLSSPCHPDFPAVSSEPFLHDLIVSRSVYYV